MSQTDKKKVEEVMQSMRESFGYSKTSMGGKPAVIDAGNISIIPQIRPQTMPPPIKKQRDIGKGRVRAEEKDFLAIKSALDAYLLKKGAQDKISINVNKRGLVVSLKEAGFFDSGSAAVKKDSIELLTMVAESLNSFNNPFRVEGHTDNIPISSGQFKSNWELSTTRATNIVHYLIERHDFEPNLISAAGYGEYRPVADNASSEGRAKNRRVDIVMMSQEGTAGEP
jgi:chemotaxis protein MotB